MSQDGAGLPPAVVAGVSGGVGGAALGNPVSKTLLKGVSPPDPNEIDSSSAPSVDQKLFLVVSVALATVCFFTNVVQVTLNFNSFHSTPTPYTPYHIPQISPHNETR